MNKTLEIIVRHLESIKPEIDRLLDEDLEMLRNHLRLLELKVMRLREKRRRGNYGDV